MMNTGVVSGDKTFLCFDELDLKLLLPNLSRRNVGDDSKIIPLWSKSNLNLRSEPVYYEFEVIGSVPKDNASRDPKSYGTGQKHRNSGEKLDIETFIRLINVVSVEPLKNTFTAIDNDTIQITAISGDVLRVSIENFNGQSSSRAGVYRCKICRIVTEDIETHKSSIGHMKKVITPIENLHCIREIDDTWSHCILCNEMMETVGFHIYDDENHTLLLGQALITSPNDNVMAKPNVNVMAKQNDNVVAKPNDNVMAKQNDNVVAKPNDNVMAKPNDNDVAKPNDNDVAKPNDNVMAKPGDNVMAKPNDNVMAKPNDNVMAKPNDNVIAKPNDNVMAQPNDNVMAKPNGNVEASTNDNAKAQTNEIVVVTTSENSEVSRSATDKTEAKTAINKSTISSNVEQWIICGVCNIRIPKENLESHNNSVSHKQKLEDMASIANFHLCAICQVKVANYVTNIEEHESGRKHNNAKKRLNLLASATNTSDSTISKRIPPSSLPANINVQKAANKLAVVSKKAVSQTSVSHVSKGSLTLRQVTTLANIAATLKNENHVYCYTCSLEMHRNDLAGHLNGYNHYNKLKNIGINSKSTEKDNQSISCPVCNVLVPNYPPSIESHRQGAKHQKILLKNTFVRQI